jgi:hypothetical protein
MRDEGRNAIKVSLPDVGEVANDIVTASTDPKKLFGRKALNAYGQVTRRTRWSPISLCFVILIVWSGCTNTSKEVYRSQMQEIEDAYRKNEITKAEYLRLKFEAENAYHQRRATIMSGGGR